MSFAMENEYQQIMTKISGYLEKKGRKKMMSCYKKYWFVLEGRLLLYYKSKDEYDAISPCKGFINLGPTSNIKPCSSNAGVFQIASKTTTTTLRAETREEQQKWMQALMSALNQRNDFRKLNYFRHSIGELSPTDKKVLLQRQNTLTELVDGYPADSNVAVIEKLQKIGGKSYGVPHNLQRSKTFEQQRQMSFSDESIPSSSNNCQTDVHFRKSVIEESEEYGKFDLMRRASSIESVDSSSDGIYERIPSNDSIFIRREIFNRENQNTDPTFITENDMYWNKSNNSQKVSGSTEYSYDDAIDFNDNNIQPQMRAPLKGPKDNVYAEAVMINENRNTIRNSAEYADIGEVDGYGDADEEYVEIDDVRNHQSVSSQGSNEDKTKRIFAFGRKSKPSKKKSEEKHKVRKSESFLQRVWNKKSKKKTNKKEISQSTNNIVEGMNMTDDIALKTLNELKDILKKQTSIVEQLHETKQVKQNVVVEDAEKKEINKIVQNDMSSVTGSVDRNHQQESQQSCAPLPLRNKKHEAPKAKPPSVPPKMKKKANTAILDDILAHLKTQSETLLNLVECQNNDEVHAVGINKEDDNKEGKVKELIKRFSIGKEEGVELRQKSHNWKLKAPFADSNDLDVLLGELAKVTTAPILTPGVTTSLINPEISDKEILKLVPIRRRRLSDPDYDVPRPHRSLTNLPKKDDNALEATRFFGPILKPSDYESHATNRPPTPPADYLSNLPSITPDSLEVCKVDLSHDELRKVSFESHDYLNFNKTSHHNLSFLVGNNAYADPRLLCKLKTDFSTCPEGAAFLHSVESESRFVDSLEP